MSRRKTGKTTTNNDSLSHNQVKRVERVEKEGKETGESVCTLSESVL